MRNLLLMIFELIQRKSILRSHPIVLTIDPINACNLRCPLCPTGRGELGRSVYKLVFHEFKRIIDEVGDYLYQVSFFNWGEPLLNEKVFKMIKYAHEYGIFTSISSNLNILTSNGAKALVKSGLDYLMISTSGLTQESYSKYHVKGELHRVIENINRIIKWKHEFSTSSPFIEWKYLVFRHNQHEVDQVERFAKAIGVDGTSIIVAGGDSEWVLSGEIKTYPRARVRARACNYLWYNLIINPDGGISPCCIVYKKEYDFGDIARARKDLSLREIWNNPKFIAARSIFSEVELSTRDIICNTCHIVIDFIRARQERSFNCPIL